MLIYLSEHPDQFQRIASLKTPRDVSREMAKIEARLEAATASTSSRPSVSKAKPPVRLVTGSPATATVEPSDESSFDDHYKFYQAKRRAR